MAEILILLALLALMQKRKLEPDADEVVCSIMANVPYWHKKLRSSLGGEFWGASSGSAHRPQFFSFLVKLKPARTQKIINIFEKIMIVQDRNVNM